MGGNAGRNTAPVLFNAAAGFSGQVKNTTMRNVRGQNAAALLLIGGGVVPFLSSAELFSSFI